NAGADIEQLLLMTLNDINDVPNAPRATTLTPKVPDRNEQFLGGIRLSATLRARGATELVFGTSAGIQGGPDPLPRRTVQAHDLRRAARDGYVDRDRADALLALIMKETGRVGFIRPEDVDSPEMAGVARIYRLKPGVGRYRLKPDLREQANGGSTSPQADTI